VIVDETIVGTLDVEDAQTDAFQDPDIAFFESGAAALAGLYV
jgi:putative methionine-R-sulfoxide reductase with GAF domain